MTTRPRRILYVIDKMVRAGAQRHLRHLLAGLDRAEFEPVLCCLLERGPLAGELEGEGIPVESLDLKNIMGFRFLRAVGGIRKIIILRRINLVHSYLFAANLVSPPAGFLAGVPVITSRRDTGFWMGHRHLLAQRAVNPLTRKITVNSRAVAEYLRRKERVGEKKIALIYNGTEVPKTTAPSVRTDRPGAGIVIGALGNIRPVKGYRYLLEAVRLLPPEVNWELQIAGRSLDEVCRGELLELSSRAALSSRVRFPGEVTDAAKFLRSLDIFVLPSLAEGFSNALIEAMAQGRPVVATTAGGNSEVIIDGENGFLIPPGDPQILAGKLKRLADDPVLRRRFGRAARRRVGELFSVSAMCRNYRDLYYECF